MKIASVILLVILGAVLLARETEPGFAKTALSALGGACLGGALVVGMGVARSRG